MTNTSPVIVALDYPVEADALALIKQLDPQKCRLKIGKEMFTHLGPAFVEKVQGMDFDVFLDLKFHDIPNTVAAACAAGADLGVWMMNVHASGGRRMMEAARDRLEAYQNRPQLIAVTILTSMAEADIHEMGFSGTPADNVKRLAILAHSSGMDGVVCSPLEAAMIRENTDDSFKLVTPGVRPGGSAADDQRRVMTPAQAMANGSSYLVIGRPITQADNPLQALESILAELS